ncbi:unnamed protein product [Didymodactylos carnosus]|uniref:Uncharacterized protein n=1 Tax=Didymodactylos carnosus TaxID=1234261 RepID=A0A815IXQ4_9BILA|nr:unnamed protein product [Didymodactylos carnosus]CAF1369418.1 unnamed protein product [Didymodactylos carnosus]CAF4051727.1 unnamed protein product [Didymodactylos carnosus]CAF4254179.1 unnamed protein product [Didymodactylos carnosus]
MHVYACAQRRGACLNQYSRCNSILNCKQSGEDELQCYPFDRCQLNEHYCLNKTNGAIECLSIEQYYNNTIIDCLGASDEQDQCRSIDDSQEYASYHCLNETKCISVLELCDCNQDCEYNDDELLVCPWMTKCVQGQFQCMDGSYIFVYQRCDGNLNCKPLGEDELLCDLSPKWKRIHFHTDHFNQYPLVSQYCCSYAPRQTNCLIIHK